MRDGVLNCPNCGAPVTGGRCEYCGTLFLDFGALSMEEPTYLRILVNGRYTFFRCVIRNAEMKMVRGCSDDYGRCFDGSRVFISTPPEYTFTFEAVGAPNEKGLVFIESKSPALDPYAQELAGLDGNQ